MTLWSDSPPSQEGGRAGPSRRPPPFAAARTPASRSAGWWSLGAVGAAVFAGAAISLTASHGLALALLVGAPLFGMCVYRPPLGLLGLLLLGMFHGELARRIPAVDGTLPTLRLVLTGALLARSMPWLPLALQRVPAWPLLAWFIMASLWLVVPDRPVGQTLTGLKVTFEPVAVLLVSAVWLKPRHLLRAAMLVLPVLLIQLAFAYYQSRSGVAGLLEAGYSYGANVREDRTGDIRALGTFAYGIPFGHTMAVLSVAYFALFLRGPRRAWRLVGLGGAAMALTSVYFAGNRTGLLGAVVVGVWLLILDRRQTAGRVLKVALIAPCLIAVGALLPQVSGDFSAQFLTLESLQVRMQTWGQALDLGSLNLIFGDGTGTAGVAASLEARGSRSVKAVTDNYYLAVLLQYGLVGLSFLIAFLFATGHRLLRASSDASDWLQLTALGVLLYLALSMITLNTWEDYPTPGVVWLIVGGASAAARTAQQFRSGQSVREEESPLPIPRPVDSIRRPR